MHCLAFAEPDHGSDLGAVETRAEFVGDEIFVTGVKTFVAGADRADTAIVLCRAAEGQVCVEVPLHDNNVDIRPIRTLNGEDALFELRFDAARGSLADLPAQPTPWLEAEREFWDLVKTARENGRNTDPNVRQQLAWAYSQVRVIKLLAERDVSLARLMWAEYHRKFGEIAVDIMGADALIRADGEGYMTRHWQQVFLNSRGDTIASGTTEIQRTTIAERTLGLPK